MSARFMWGALNGNIGVAKAYLAEGKRRAMRKKVLLAVLVHSDSRLASSICLPLSFLPPYSFLLLHFCPVNVPHCPGRQCATIAIRRAAMPSLASLLALGAWQARPRARSSPTL